MFDTKTYLWLQFSCIETSFLRKALVTIQSSDQIMIYILPTARTSISYGRWFENLSVGEEMI